MKQYNNSLIEDIFISGFIETDGEIPIFKPMFWWCFFKLDNGKIIEISSNDGNIKLVEISKISSNFDLEEVSKYKNVGDMVSAIKKKLGE